MTTSITSRVTAGMPSLPPFRSSTRSRGRGWFALAGASVVIGVSIGGWFALRPTIPTNNAPHIAAATTDTLARAPRGTRIRVRVVNTTSTQGLAKRATFALRDYGYDVVDFEGDVALHRASTLIVTHGGHTDWAERIRRALGTGTIESRSDSSRLVDVTVFVADDWKSSSQPFRP